MKENWSIIRMAVDRFYVDTGGSGAKSVHSLISIGYLKSLPTNPYTGEPMKPMHLGDKFSPGDFSMFLMDTGENVIIIYEPNPSWLEIWRNRILLPFDEAHRDYKWFRHRCDRDFLEGVGPGLEDSFDGIAYHLKPDEAIRRSFAFDRNQWKQAGRTLTAKDDEHKLKLLDCIN